MIKKIRKRDWEITFIDVDNILSTFFNEDIKDEKVIAFVINYWTQIDDVLEILRKRQRITFDELLKRTNLSREQLHRLLDILERHEYVKIEGGKIIIASEERGRESKLKQISPLIVVIISILVGLGIFTFGFLPFLFLPLAASITSLD